jgi:hypothetical protein
MRQILSRSLLTVAAASSVLAATGGYAQADSGADSTATGSPGLLSGNSVQVPVDVPVNACGNTVDAPGLLNPAFGNSCGNTSSPAPTTPPAQVPPPRTENPPTPSKTQPATPVQHHQLAETGLNSHTAGFAGAAGAALLLGGALLYRRSHTAARSARTSPRNR